VRDDDDRVPLRDQPADALEELLDLLGREHCGGFVEYDEVGIQIKGFQDLDALLLSHREARHSGTGVERDAVPYP